VNKSTDRDGEWRRGWTLVLAAAAGMSLSGVGSASLGVMMEPVEAEMDWTRTQITLGPSLVPLVVVVLSTFAGLAIDRLGPRLVAIAATLLYCAGLASFGLIGNELWQWWALWAVIGLAASSMPTVWLSPVSKVFTKGRGLAVALTLSGTGITTTLVPILANAQVEQAGWRSAYLVLGVIWFVLVLALVLPFFRARSAPPTIGTDGTSAPPAPLTGLTPREGFRSPAFYKLAFGAFLSMSAGIALILNLVPVLRSVGLTASTAANVAALFGVSSIVGRVIGGWLLDRISASAIAATAAAGSVILPAVLLAAPGSVPIIAVGVAIYALLGGAKLPAVAYLASGHLGQRAFGTLYGAINTMVALGVAVGPIAANLVYDSVQSYVPVMWAAVPLLLVGAALYASLGSYPAFAPREAD
jgi:MFS family permease